MLRSNKLAPAGALELREETMRNLITMHISITYCVA